MLITMYHGSYQSMVRGSSLKGYVVKEGHYKTTLSKPYYMQA